MKTKIPTSMKQCFRNELRKTRVDRNLSQEEMAHTLSISTRSYSDLEHGKSFCSLFTFLLFLNIYGDSYFSFVELMLSHLDTGSSGIH